LFTDTKIGLKKFVETVQNFCHEEEKNLSGGIMRKLFSFALLTTIGMSSALFAQQGHDFGSWREWASPITNNIPVDQVTQFRANLARDQQSIFDNASTTTQLLAVIIYNGLKNSTQTTAQRNQSTDLYSMAFKIANKAEVGYYLDKAFRRLDYNK